MEIIPATVILRMGIAQAGRIQMETAIVMHVETLFSGNLYSRPMQAGETGMLQVMAPGGIRTKPITIRQQVRGRAVPGMAAVIMIPAGVTAQCHMVLAVVPAIMGEDIIDKGYRKKRRHLRKAASFSQYASMYV